MDIIINENRDSVPVDSKPLSAMGDWLNHFLLCAGFDRKEPPLADLLRQIYQLDGEWIVIEPICWEASHNDAVIVARGSDMQLTDKESRALFAETARFLAEDALVLHYHNAHTWLMKVDGKPLIKSIPTHLMLHQSMMPVVRAMDDSMYWQKLLTELQMFLSTHPCNTARLLPVNGLWLYGSGRFSFDGRSFIMTDDERILSIFPSKVHPLAFEKSIARNTILLVNDSSNIDMQQLLAMSAKHETRWYWNNIAWLASKKNFWKRFGK